MILDQTVLEIFEELISFRTNERTLAEVYPNSTNRKRLKTASCPSLNTADSLHHREPGHLINRVNHIIIIIIPTNQMEKNWMAHLCTSPVWGRPACWGIHVSLTLLSGQSTLTKRRSARASKLSSGQAAARLRKHGRGSVVGRIGRGERRLGECSSVATAAGRWSQCQFGRTCAVLWLEPGAESAKLGTHW